MSSAKRARWTSGIWGRHLYIYIYIYIHTYILYRVGARMEPCGTSACTFRDVDSSPSAVTLNFIMDRNELISFMKLAENCNFDNFYSKPGCHVVSKAFSMSENTAAVDIL
jgi:hypothetical protein